MEACYRRRNSSLLLCISHWDGMRWCNLEVIQRRPSCTCVRLTLEFNKSDIVTAGHKSDLFETGISAGTIQAKPRTRKLAVDTITHIHECNTEYSFPYTCALLIHWGHQLTFPYGVVLIEDHKRHVSIHGAQFLPVNDWHQTKNAHTRTHVRTHARTHTHTFGPLETHRRRQW